VTIRKDTEAKFDLLLSASDTKIVSREPTHDKSLEEETILLVDDDEINIEVMRDMLEMLGYQVILARNGSDALAIYREKEKEINLVILDMIMPDMTGGDVFDRLKEINTGVRVILSTGCSLAGQVSDLMSRGCREFIQKPFQIEELFQKIRRTLNER
jgi:CheY-like chemotaxis protein